MTVKELREKLDLYNDDAVIMMSIDPEGNGFNEFSGDITIGKWDGEYAGEVNCEEGIDYIILWP